MPQVRRSPSGGWQGTFSEEQMQSIKDNNTTAPPPGTFLYPAGYAEFPTESMEEQLEYIDDGVSSLYAKDTLAAGEQTSSNFDTDEDLIKAYDAAMAIDIEPENPDVERAMSGSGTIAMSGVGSGRDSPNFDLPRIV